MANVVKVKLLYAGTRVPAHLSGAQELKDEQPQAAWCDNEASRMLRATIQGQVWFARIVLKKAVESAR
jgi:hypothetical protein